jgi:hypothetical protein
MSHMSRRRMLGVSLGATAVAGLELLAAPATAASAASPRSCPPLPEVPGMRGNRLANEVWYQLDEVGLYSPSAEFIEAFQAVRGVLSAAYPGINFEGAMTTAWIVARRGDDYPNSFLSMFEPVRDAMQVMSDVQIGVYNTYYPGNWPGLTRAMIDFGQGILYDPRHPIGAKVHMMDGDPPPGYHTWHAFNRAFQLLDISPRYWGRFDPLVGLGWALQSTAKPVEDADNAPLPSSVVAGLARQWLKKTPEESDQAFLSYPYPPGIS